MKYMLNPKNLLLMMPVQLTSLQFSLADFHNNVVTYFNAIIMSYLRDYPFIGAVFLAP